MGPKPVTGVLKRREKVEHRHTKRRMPYEDTETHREEHCINTETKVGVIGLQTKKCQGLLETTRSWQRQ